MPPVLSSVFKYFAGERIYPRPIVRLVQGRLRDRALGYFKRNSYDFLGGGNLPAGCSCVVFKRLVFHFLYQHFSALLPGWGLIENIDQISDQ